MSIRIVGQDKEHHAQVTENALHVKGIHNGDGSVLVAPTGRLSTANSTNTPLLAGAVFTGTAENVLNFSTIALMVYADVAGTLLVQFSYDGSDWHDGETYTINAGATKFFTPPCQSQYMRVVYTNGAADQTEFHLHVTLKGGTIKPSSHNIDDPITDQDDAELTKSVITGKRTDGIYDNVSLTNGSNMKVSLEELENGISSNNNSQLNVTQFDSTGNEIESQQVASSTDNIDGKYGLVTASGLYARISDSAVRPLRANPSTHALISIEYSHHEIHNGSHFFFTELISLANGATQDYLITTPNTVTWGHFLYNITGQLGVTIGIYEGADRTGTTLQTVYNNNRNSLNTAGITVHKGQSGGTTDGTNIHPCGFGSGTSGGSGGALMRENEIVLKQNTKYIFRVTNRASVTNLVCVDLTWYEHADRD